MKKSMNELHGVSPTRAHELAGRVVGIFRKAGLTDREALTNIHQVTETHAYDPQGLKTWLRHVVDLLTIPDRTPIPSAGRAYQEQEHRLDVLSGDVITGLMEFEVTPDVVHNEHFTLMPYEVEESEWPYEEDE